MFLIRLRVAHQLSPTALAVLRTEISSRRLEYATTIEDPTVVTEAVASCAVLRQKKRGKQVRRVLVPPSERWYIITRGLRVGYVKGL